MHICTPTLSAGSVLLCSHRQKLMGSLTFLNHSSDSWDQRLFLLCEDFGLFTSHYALRAQLRTCAWYDVQSKEPPGLLTLTLKKQFILLLHKNLRSATMVFMFSLQLENSSPVNSLPTLWIMSKMNLKWHNFLVVSLTTYNNNFLTYHPCLTLFKPVVNSALPSHTAFTVLPVPWWELPVHASPLLLT